MRNVPVYFLLALCFIGIIKLLQVTSFDDVKYKKIKEASFTKGSKNVSTAKKKSKEKNTQVPTVSAKKEKPKQKDLPDQSLAKNTSTYERDTSYLSKLKRNYLEPILAELPADQLREDLVVRYYKHKKDGNKIYTLSELGYYLHQKSATETEGYGSNIIYYGEDVPVEDIQIIVLTLITNGLSIKSIAPTKFLWKDNAVEIGTDIDLINQKALSLQDVQSFTKE